MNEAGKGVILRSAEALGVQREFGELTRAAEACGDAMRTPPNPEDYPWEPERLSSEPDTLSKTLKVSSSRLDIPSQKPG